jgi:hypothetical protein
MEPFDGYAAFVLGVLKAITKAVQSRPKAVLVVKNAAPDNFVDM